MSLEGVKFRHGHVEQVEALYAFVPKIVFPVGFIWYSHILCNHINIGYIFVHERCRRQGVATRMLEQLTVWYPLNVVCTAVGNEFSEPWLRVTGFVKEPAGWFLRPPQVEPCPMI